MNKFISQRETIEHLGSNWKNREILQTREYYILKLENIVEAILLKLGRFSSVFGVLTFRGFYFHHLIAKLWKMIFSTLWVNYKNKFQIFLKTSTKKNCAG